MQIFVKAVNSGKHIRVRDRIGGAVSFESFVDIDDSKLVNIASNDGTNGNIDIDKRLSANNPWVVHVQDYDARRDEVINVD